MAVIEGFTSTGVVQGIRVDATGGIVLANTSIGNIIGAIGSSANSSSSLLAHRISSAVAGAFIKASVGRLYGYSLINTSAGIRYVHIYNKVSAPTVGTDTPVATIPIPAGGVVNLMTDIGYYLSTGISWAVTTDAITTPITAGAAGDILGSFWYF